MLTFLFGRLYYLDVTSSCAVILHLCMNGMSRQLWLTNHVHEIGADILHRGWIQQYGHKYALENWGRGLKFFHLNLFTKHSKKKIVIVLQKHSCVCYFKQSKKIKFNMRFYLSKLVCPQPGVWKFQPSTIWLSTPGLTFSVLFRYIQCQSMPYCFSYLLLQLYFPLDALYVANNSFVLPCGGGGLHF